MMPPDAERMTPAEQALMMAAVTFGELFVTPWGPDRIIRVMAAQGALERAAIAVADERSPVAIGLRELAENAPHNDSTETR